jgi:hypothetical protein
VGAEREPPDGRRRPRSDADVRHVWRAVGAAADDRARPPVAAVRDAGRLAGAAARHAAAARVAALLARVRAGGVVCAGAAVSRRARSVGSGVMRAGPSTAAPGPAVSRFFQTGPAGAMSGSLVGAMRAARRATVGRPTRWLRRAQATAARRRTTPTPSAAARSLSASRRARCVALVPRVAPLSASARAAGRAGAVCRLAQRRQLHAGARTQTKISTRCARCVGRASAHSHTLTLTRAHSSTGAVSCRRPSSRAKSFWSVAAERCARVLQRRVERGARHSSLPSSRRDACRPAS